MGKKTGPVIITGNFVFALDDEWTPIGWCRSSTDPKKRAADNLGIMVVPFLKALSWLSCKNTKLTTVSPPPKLSRSYQKKHDRPLVQYKVLEVLPISGKRREVKAPGTGSTPALHRVRRHMKTYTKDHPLFGRITGRFVWQSHIRGDASKGIIVKDYDLKPGGKK
jgi:hypothetical protein